MEDKLIMEIPENKLIEQVKEFICHVCHQEITETDKEHKDYLFCLSGVGEKPQGETKNNSNLNLSFHVETVCHKKCWGKPIKKYKDWRTYQKLINVLE